jgi:hypothetical protein
MLIAGGSSMDNPRLTGGKRCWRFQRPHPNPTRLARISSTADSASLVRRLCPHAGGRHGERSPRPLLPISRGSATRFCRRARRRGGTAAQTDDASTVTARLVLRLSQRLGGADNLRSNTWESLKGRSHSSPVPYRHRSSYDGITQRLGEQQAHHIERHSATFLRRAETVAGSEGVSRGNPLSFHA